MLFIGEHSDSDTQGAPQKRLTDYTVKEQHALFQIGTVDRSLSRLWRHHEVQSWLKEPALKCVYLM